MAATFEMVANVCKKMRGASVTFLIPATMVPVQNQHQTRFMARLVYCLGTVFVKQCLGGGASTGSVS